MKLSALTTVLVPPVDVTLMPTVPLPAGELATISLSEMTVKLLADVEPKDTPVVPVKPVPVIVTEVPPAAGPSVGAMAFT